MFRPLRFAGVGVLPCIGVPRGLWTGRDSLMRCLFVSDDAHKRTTSDTWHQRGWICPRAGAIEFKLLAGQPTTCEPASAWRYEETV